MVLLLKSDELANYLKIVGGEDHYKKIINHKKISLKTIGFQ